MSKRSKENEQSFCDWQANRLSTLENIATLKKDSVQIGDMILHDDVFNLTKLIQYKERIIHYATNKNAIISSKHIF